MSNNPHERECFAIYDTELNTYSDPFYSASTTEAKRAVSGFLHNAPDSLHALHSNVFQLHHLGSFDVITGEHISSAEDMFICSLTHLQPKAVDKPTETD